MKALIFDTETTGLPLHRMAKLALQPHIIELGYVLLDERGQELASGVKLFNPGVPLAPEITKITGLTDADLCDAPPFAGYIPEFEAVLRDCSHIVAHNLPFDWTMLELEYRHAGLDVQSIPQPARRVCTVQEFAPLWGRRMKLVELYEDAVGVPLAQTHRALDDVRALAEICRRTGLLKEDRANKRGGKAH